MAGRRSTGTVRYQLTDVFRNAIEIKEIALFPFLDIEGAFDNASYKEMQDALIRKRAGNTLIFWMGRM